MPDSTPNEVAVVVPAAGEGTRLGGPRKQYRTLGDRPLLVQVLLLFDQHPKVGHLIISVPTEHVEEVSDRLQAAGLRSVTAVVSGGKNRQASVRHGLRAVPDPVEVVLVHDAVRPFVSAAEIGEVIDTVRTEGAAALAIPVADTLRRERDGAFGETVSRQGLYRMQTPQGFRRAWLEEAHREAAANGIVATDDVDLVQRTGRTVIPVEGSRRNFKITTPADWTLAQQLWDAWMEDPDRTGTSDSSQG